MTYDVQSPEGARLFPYLPNWAQGFDVRRSFRTDSWASRNNSEQRRSLRNGSPRFTVEYRTIVSGDDRREAEHFLRYWQNQPTVVPDFARWARTTASASGGATAIVIDPLPAWVAEGQNLLLCGADSEMEQVLVDSVAGTTINLTDPLGSAWPSGSVVQPTFFGLLNEKTSKSRRTRGTAEIAVELAAYPGGEPPRATGTAWATLDSREVFTLQPDYAGPPNISSVFPVEQIDYGIGRTAQFRPIAEAADMVEAEFNGLSPTEASEAEQFFDRMKGRRTAFWMPTWEKDFVLNASAGSGTSAFTATGSDIATAFGATDYSAIMVGVAVYLTDGTEIFRRISDISASGGNSVVTVNAPWGANLSTDNVARICWMPLTRFSSDDMVTSWVTPLKANTRLGFQQVRL